MKITINGTDFKAMLVNAAAVVEKNKQALNDLNVFPVPDGDTGTNMSMTINYAVNDIKNYENERISKMADKIRQGLTLGSHGNSGTITSLLFNGMAKLFEGHDSADPLLFAKGLSAGADKAYSVVYKPAEGTILTVARKASERAIERASGGCNFEEMMISTLEAAYEALALTPTQNPVLAKAGVVDAGAKGYCHILEGMLAALRGVEMTVEEQPQTAAKTMVFSSFTAADIENPYDTELIVIRNPEVKDAMPLRAFLSTRGDSLVMSDDEDIIKIHIHTQHPGLVLEEALKYGNLNSIKIEDMRDQHAEQLRLEKEKNEVNFVAPSENAYGFVAVASGQGIMNVFLDLGADFVVEGGQTMNPSTEIILRNINKTPAETVFILPNNKNIIMTAEQASELTEKKAVVIPTRSIPEGITAMLHFNPDEDAETNEKAMREGLAQVRTGSITFAARDSVFDEISIKEGDYLALAGGKLCITGKNFNEIINALCDSLDIGSAEFVTIFSGQDANESDTKLLMDIFKQKASPSAEFNLIEGEQPVYYYIIGVE